MLLDMAPKCARSEDAAPGLKAYKHARTHDGGLTSCSTKACPISLVDLWYPPRNRASPPRKRITLKPIYKTKSYFLNFPPEIRKIIYSMAIPSKTSLEVRAGKFAVLPDDAAVENAKNSLALEVLELYN